MNEFGGNCPTLQQVFSISPEKWQTFPGFGPTLLTELEAIMRDDLDQMKGYAPGQLSDAELLARLERLQRDLKRFRRDLEQLINKRSKEQLGPGGSDLH